MALTNEQKEFIKQLSNLPFMVERAKELFPEAFEPELVDFTDAEIGFGLDIELATSAAETMGFPRNRGLYFSGNKMKNPKLTEVGFGGWLLTFEKK